MQKLACLLLVLLAASLVSAKLEADQQVLQETAQTLTGGDDTAGDDAAEVKIIRCCIEHWSECEPDFCTTVQNAQKTLYDSLNSAKITVTMPDGDVDEETLGKMHEKADAKQKETLTSFLEAEAAAGRLGETLHLAYRFAHPDGIIKYKFQTTDGAPCAKAATEAVKFLFESAVNEFHKGTCLRWKQDNTATLIVGSSPGAGSGTNGLGTSADQLCIDSATGNQHLQLSTLLHEMGHLAGFAHTHKRSDVAQYITFSDAGIKTYAQSACGLGPTIDYPASDCMRSWRYQFQAQPFELDVTGTHLLTTVPGTNYDYKSIMHYPFKMGATTMMTPDATKYAAAKSANGNKDIKPGEYGLTANDLDAVNKLYNCLKLTIDGKRGSATLSSKKAYFGKTQPQAMLKHIVEEATGLDETTVTLKKSDGSTFAGTLTAAGITDGATIKAETP